MTFIQKLQLYNWSSETMSYTLKEIIWAKPDNYPWWPATVHNQYIAKIAKLPDHNKNNYFYKVLFIGEEN